MELSVLLYVGSLILSTFVRETILVVYYIQSNQLVELFSAATIIIVLEIGRRVHCIHIPSLSSRILRTLLPLPVTYAGLMLTGMIQTVALSRAVATVSRRILMFMIMILEERIVGIRTSLTIQYSIVVMLVGAMISAANNVSLLWYHSYTIILINNMITALNGVYYKKILNTGELNNWGLMYYDSFFMIVPGSIVAWISGELEEEINSSWHDKLYWCHLLILCIMDTALTYSMLRCTQAYSALTVTAISNLWSIFLTYVIVIIVGDSIKTWNVFVGLNISLAGGILYMYANFNFYKKPGIASKDAHVMQENNVI